MRFDLPVSSAVQGLFHEQVCFCLGRSGHYLLNLDSELDQMIEVRYFIPHIILTVVSICLQLVN